MISWNAEGVLGKIGELSRWLSNVKVDVATIQEAQLSGKTLTVPGYQTDVVSRRARGRRDGGPVRGGDVAILVRNGLNFTTITARCEELTADLTLGAPPPHPRWRDSPRVSTMRS